MFTLHSQMKMKMTVGRRRRTTTTTTAARTATATATTSMKTTNNSNNTNTMTKQTTSTFRQRGKSWRCIGVGNPEGPPTRSRPCTSPASRQNTKSTIHSQAIANSHISWRASWGCGLGALGLGP